MQTLDTPLWHQARARALARDADRCTVARLIGGDCHPTLHVHHVVPRSEGGDAYALDNLVTVCASHHPMLEALRRSLTRRRHVTCRHYHPYPQGREECERRLARVA